VKYSESELYGNRTEDEELVDSAVRLVAALPPALFSAVAGVAHAHGLTPAQVKVILQVGARGRMTMGEIACGLSVSMPATSEIVDRLVEAGQLVRAIDPTDRRRVLIAPTAESLRVVEEVNELRREQIRAALALLNEDERPVFVRSLHALLHGLTNFGSVTAACSDETTTDRAQPARAAGAQSASLASTVVNADRHR
jgi:DNA-binding MarR family transcriptional regulator